MCLPEDPDAGDEIDEDEEVLTGHVVLCFLRCVQARLALLVVNFLLGQI